MRARRRRSGCAATPKFAGSITIVTDEPELPYERPPLSKDYLAGHEDRSSDLLLRPPHFWQERNINIV